MEMKIVKSELGIVVLVVLICVDVALHVVPMP